jgi:hypothetical protein
MQVLHVLQLKMPSFDFLAALRRDDGVVSLVGIGQQQMMPLASRPLQQATAGCSAHGMPRTRGAGRLAWTASTHAGNQSARRGVHQARRNCKGNTSNSNSGRNASSV